jgi:hypothetical protein
MLPWRKEWEFVGGLTAAANETFLGWFSVIPTDFFPISIDRP